MNRFTLSLLDRLKGTIFTLESSTNKAPNITGGKSCAALFAVLVMGIEMLSGCGLGMLQTAKTTPEGELDFSLAAGYVHNEMIDVRGFAFTNIPLSFGARYGLTGHLDVGAVLFMGLGIMADVKYNFLPPDSPLGMSLQGGLAAAYDNLADATTMHLPVRALVSYEIAGGVFTPYAGLSFGIYWIFGYGEDESTVTNLAPRAGHGDGVIATSVGLEFFSRSACRLLIEYTYFRPVIDDPGDKYSFAQNHIFQIGTRF